MVYLLGGSPRVGKSTIAGKVAKRHEINVVSTDSLCSVLTSNLTPESSPGLFIVRQFNEMDVDERINMMRTDAGKRVEYQVQEGLAVWKAVLPFIQRESEEGRDIMVEGVAILPELVNQIEDFDYRAVFIGSQSDGHSEKIKKSAETNEYDWMRYASDEYIDAFAVFVKEMSAYFEKECEKYSFEYLEMGMETFEGVASQVTDKLFT